MSVDTFGWLIEVQRAVSVGLISQEEMGSLREQDSITIVSLMERVQREG